MKYSIDTDTKQASQLTESDLLFLLEQIENRQFEKGTYIPMRATTPKFFCDVVRDHSGGEVNPKNLPMAATVEHVAQNMEDEDRMDYGKEMGNPSYIVKQKNGRYAEVVTFFNSKKRRVIVSVDFATEKNNYKYKEYMNGYNSGFYNIIVTQYEHDDFKSYLKGCEVVYDKQKMNGKYQVGSGRVVTVTHDTPFITDNVSYEEPKVNKKLSREMDPLVALERQVKLLRQQKEYWKSQTKRTDGKKADSKEVRKLVLRLHPNKKVETA